jgi:2-polyprenyl-3-methyl-5-hydroxy-6-metoxy-1,4-benzoquinol methylase
VASRYSQRVDLEHWNSSHALAVLSVPPGSRVLDLGAADGSVARALKERGCVVWGIEFDERAADAASRVCDRVIVANLETPDAFDALDGETFDIVLALDVLEHLRDPTPVLRRAAAYLTPKGVAVVSIPNVTHGALRVSLLEGRFDYTEQGLLDRTHLRFFDRRSAERWIEGAGLTIEQTLRVRRELDETEIADSKDSLSAELLDRLSRDPDATTYQFVFVAALKERLPASPPGGTLAERLIAENDSLLKQFRALETYTRSVEADRAARMEDAARFQSIRLERDELVQELQRRVREAHGLHADLKQSKAEVVVKEGFISDLRQQLTSLATERDESNRKRKKLAARCEELTAQVNELRRKTNSAGFRIVQAVIRRLRSFPLVFKPARALARRIAGRGAVD